MATIGDINPRTGKPYSAQEIIDINSGKGMIGEQEIPAGAPYTHDEGGFVVPSTVGATGTVGAGLGAASTGGATITPVSTPKPKPKPTATTEPFPEEAQGALSDIYGALQGTEELLPFPGGPGGEPCDADGVPCSISGKPPVAPEITPAPPYEISPEMQEMMDLYGETLTDWVTSGGYGLTPEVQAQMIQQQTDTLKAREQENIRIMKNNMERRGITNSGYLQANMNQITSNTTVALAGAIADVQIKSALMKMASFEKGMGAMAQYLGFLSEQSQLAYAPEFATWQAQQLATMQVWQGKLDVYKMELNQAYQTQNMEAQAYWTGVLAEQSHGFNLELAEMEIETNQNIAMAQGIGGIFGTILGFIFGS